MAPLLPVRSRHAADRIEGACSGADAIIADLDAVAPPTRPGRGSLAAALDARPLILRINGFGSAWFERTWNSADSWCERSHVAKAEDPTTCKP
jgi:citrate lyase beta subunit